ncbi:MAG: 16S rRNA (cytosine(1402)-N(4))-methyltransferase [Candidatus Roizmanbacteria bacterium]|nr:16S rRNA (cytosine(1402)-N(4))-methyltransferase [Candidatus Roizmanbacteria bacterium]
MTRNYHTPLFLNEIRELLHEYLVKVLVDATFAEGGHGLTYAKEGYTVLGIEYDKELYTISKKKVQDAGVACTLVNGNFANLDTIVKKTGIRRVDAVLFDFGISMYHLRASSRGFTMESDQKLDLRADSTAKYTGRDIITSYSKEQLHECISENIESIDTGRLVDAIVSYRVKKGIARTSDIWAIAREFSNSKYVQEAVVRGLLQALRIEVNKEEENMKIGLQKASSLLDGSGLIITITFHSREDRLVKLFFKTSKWKSVFKKPLQHTSYAFAKSARLRAYVSN